MSQTVAELERELKKHASPARARASAWYFKTGPGGYGHGDVFLGVSVPDQRRVARRFRDLPLRETARLLRSQLHEHRLTALFILVDRFQRAEETERGRIYALYLRSTRFINNWDLVDSSAPYIVGPYLLNRSRRVLHRLSRSRRLWDRRIAVLATAAFIRQGQYADTLEIAQRLLEDPHDLIHKAVGWMLRSIGDRDRAVELRWLRQFGSRMPRTMWRYAVEKLPARERDRLARAAAAR